MGETPMSALTLLCSGIQLYSAEQRIADCILADVKWAASATSAELARQSQASEATVTRLCHKLGFESYRKFQLALARDVMEQLAKQAKDWLLVGWIRFYRRHPSTIVTRWVAHVLHHSIHFGFVKTLTETIKKETAIYPRRLFGKSGEERLALCLKKANARKEELEKTGAYVEIVRQEPFTIAKDQLDLKVYLLVSRQGMVNQKIQVEEIEL